MFQSVNYHLLVVKETLSLFMKNDIRYNLLKNARVDIRSCSSYFGTKKDIFVDGSPSGSDLVKNSDLPLPSKKGEINSNIVEPDGEIALETYAPYISPTFNFAAYVNKSPTLQELVKLGVNLHSWEKRKGIPEFVLRLDFERDMKDVIRFLYDNGVAAESLGTVVTKNPLIFKETVENLKVRVNYLESKRFTSEMMAHIFTKNPYWLSFSTSRIDRRLGHFQKTYRLAGSDVRELSTKQPRLITYKMDHIKEIHFAVKEIMGFQDNEIKILLLRKPKLWMMSKEALVSRFNFVHNEMGIPHKQLLETPAVLGSRLQRIKERHLFLENYGSKIPPGKSRYDPKSVEYVSLNSLVSGNDAEFCSDVAKVSIESFNAFLKSL